MRDSALLYNYLSLASNNFDLVYRFKTSSEIEQARQASLSAHACCEQYLASEATEYIDELRTFSQINTAGFSPLTTPSAWVFVPCFNEDHNLERIMRLFDRQQRTYNGTFELCFILNCPIGAENRRRLIRSSEILLQAKKSRPHIHIVTKIFPEHVASLGRARKYGFDYCTQRITELGVLRTQDTFIVCTEGDTLSLPDNYLQSYAAAFADKQSKLVQGRIEYPSHLLARSEHLALFTSVREAVHEGQSRHPNDLPEFGGLMPCGRNFAISPQLYAQIGGVDPIRRPGPEDDIIMGADITRIAGEQAKVFGGPALVTSPRREVLIIRDLLQGESTNLKRAYEDFHNTVEIRDFESRDIDEIVMKEFPRAVSTSFIPTLLSQLYQWVVSTCLKGEIATHPEAQSFKEQYLSHRLGYWEKENKLWSYGEQWLSSLPPKSAASIENAIADKALLWFQEFNSSQQLQFYRSDNGVRSILRQPIPVKISA